MDSIFFFLRDKRRLQFFLYIAVIAIPILTVCLLVISRCDDKRLAAGVDNSEGGKDYMYRGKSGIDKFPEPVAAFVAMYPESKTTYVNVRTDGAGKISGSIFCFTKDDFSKVADFYKSAGTVTEQSADGLSLEKSGTEIIISKNRIYDDDPIKGQTKFEIFFP
jgi:hypothetical protein